MTAIKNVTEVKEKKNKTTSELVYFIGTKNFKSLIEILSTNKIDNYNRGGKRKKKI